ncbi:MAG: acetyl-CoA carboxylase biotin carboxyl carrier protein [Haliea sp.]
MKNVTADEIKNLIQIFDDSEWKELALQVEDFRIFLSRDPNSAGAPWQGVQAPQAPATPVASAPATAPQQSSGEAALAAVQPSAGPAVESAPIPENCVVVKAPNLGIFYRAPKPGAAPYVELGAEVDNETEICLIEVMKLFTPVHAGMRGTVRHICVEDGEMVEFDQPLFYIELAE